MRKVCIAHTLRAVNALLRQFETHCGLEPVNAAKLLGYAYVTYSQYRNGRRPLQLYAERHIRAVMLLPMKALDALIKEHVFNGR